MQLRDLARLKEPIESFGVGSIGRIVGRCIDDSSYVLQVSPHRMLIVDACQVEAMEELADSAVPSSRH